jgi:transposase
VAEVGAPLPAGAVRQARPRTITEQRAGITAAIRHGLSNARVEAINTQIRLITRRAFGFHSPDALIAVAMLSLADLCLPLPR